MSPGDRRYQSIVDDLAGTEWTASRQLVSRVDVAVVVRRMERAPDAPEQASESTETDTVLDNGVTEDVGDPRHTGEKSIRPESPLGTQTGLAGTARSSVPASAARSASFGDLATVREMGTGQKAPVISFDTEFTYRSDGSRRIDSYQFSLLDPEDDRYRVDVVLLPLDIEARLAVEDCLAVVTRESGLWRTCGLPDSRGVPRRSFWVDGNYRASMDALYRRHRVGLVLAGHYLSADLTAFARPRSRRGDGLYRDILRRVTSASGGLVSLKPIRMCARTDDHGSGSRWIPFSITVRDGMGQSAPGSKSLRACGSVCGVEKIDVGDPIKNMSRYRRDHLTDFLAYGANDSVIVLEYLTALWGPGAVPPVTLSGGGAHALRAGIKRYWGLESAGNAAFMARFQGLVAIDEGQDTCDDGLSYYTVRSLTPVDGDANQVHSAFKSAFHGGWNSSIKIGSFPFPTYDHDIQSAYPTAMASIVDVDYESGCIEEVIKDRSLALKDFPLEYVTPLVAYVSWSFPEGVEPCIPVQVGQSIIYPRTSEGVGAAQGEGMDASGFEAFEGTWCAGPELRMALALGARVDVQIGYRLRVLEHDGGPSHSMRAAVRQMVTDRAAAKQTWGKGSLVEQMIKVATNSCFGKLAQDVADRSGWNAWEEEMESIGGSSVTSPYHAAMITSLVRALLLGMANEVSLISVTTDGFITDARDVEHNTVYKLADVFRDSRHALVGDPRVWEIKHQQDDLVNLTTRGNASRADGGVLAKAGLKTPRWIERGSTAERRWFLDVAVSRTGKVRNPYTAFPSFRELSRTNNRLDFGPVDRSPEIALDFDMKRRPLFDTVRTRVVDGYEVACFDTAPWDTVTEYIRARDIARHIAAKRPGTTGNDRPTGCLRTRDEWLTWGRRYDSRAGRRIRTAESALLTELVAAHKEGLVTVPMLAGQTPVDKKIAWLSSLGHGHFTRAQWEHMSKRDRRARVLADADIDSLADIVEDLPDW